MAIKTRVRITGVNEWGPGAVSLRFQALDDPGVSEQEKCCVFEKHDFVGKLLIDNPLHQKRPFAVGDELMLSLELVEPLPKEAPVKKSRPSKEKAGDEKKAKKEEEPNALQERP